MRIPAVTPGSTILPLIARRIFDFASLQELGDKIGPHGVSIYALFARRPAGGMQGRDRVDPSVGKDGFRAGAEEEALDAQV
jgi:hypothetical protein